MLHEIIEVPPDEAVAQRLAVVHRLAFEASAQWSACDFLANPEHAKRLILTDPGNVTGLLVLQTAADEAEVLTLAVVPEARRQGLAVALMDAGLANLRQQGVRRVFLEVAEDNGPAIRLYERIGFEQVGRRKQYYRRADGNRVDALMLMLELS